MLANEKFLFVDQSSPNVFF